MNHAVATIKTIERTSKISFWILASITALLISAYAYFVVETIWNVAERQTVQSEIVALNSKLSETEFRYMNALGAVTMESARQLGFNSATSRTAFVTKERVGQNVAIR